MRLPGHKFLMDMGVASVIAGVVLLALAHLTKMFGGRSRG